MFDNHNNHIHRTFFSKSYIRSSQSEANFSHILQQGFKKQKST